MLISDSYYDSAASEFTLQHLILSFVTFFEQHPEPMPQEPTLLSIFRNSETASANHPQFYVEFRDALIETVDKHDSQWISSNPEGLYWNDIWKSVFQPGLIYLGCDLD